LELKASLEKEIMELADSSAEDFSRANERLLQVEAELCRWEGCERIVTDILLALGFRGANDVDSGQISDPSVSTPMSQLSGGWRMKVQLAKALWLRPRLLLLDEPTNHLDFRASRWLQDKLEEYPYTIVVVSHDVSFLHGICKEILWVKDRKLESLPRDLVSQEDLLRMQRRRALRFSFSTPNDDDVENHGLSLHGVEFSYGSEKNARRRPSLLRVHDDVRFSGKSRSVLLGRNGCGKSTFLDLCTGKLSPTRGIIDRTSDLKIGHYSQLTDDLDRSDETAAAYMVRECREALAAHAGSTHSMRLREARALRARQKDASAPCTGDAVAAVRERAAEDRVTTAAAQEKRLLEIARGVLTHFGFEGDVSVTVPVSKLSGGQKACLKFAVLSLRPVHILVLDEPTNHLDAEACKALACGLSEFKGGIIAVTHDELLIYRLIHCNLTTSELLTCRNGVLRKEKQVGLSCLGALKDELRNAEEAEENSGRQSWQKEKGSRKAAAESMSTATVQTNGTVTVKSVVKSALPPWLQTHCRRPNRKRTEAATPDEPLSNQENIPANIVREHATVDSCDLVSTVCNDAPNVLRIDRSERKLRSVPAQSTVAVAADVAESHRPESWEELVVNDAPQTWEDLAMCEDASTIACPQVEMASETASENMSSNQKSEKSLEKDGDRGQSVGHGSSNHSRFRKDLVNLNKAVAKWLRQESMGEISHASVEEKIRNSVVAKQLREKNGTGFREEDFVRDALKQAAKKAAGSA
jgi:ATPase subunit of ABC transporter with duplicated ATPase domains